MFAAAKTCRKRLRARGKEMIMRGKVTYKISAVLAVSFLMGFLLVAVGCGGNGGEEPDDGQQVTEEMQETFDVETGQHFDLSLESNPTTGFAWQATQSPDEKIVQLVNNQFVAPSGDLMGAPGEEVWQFRATGAGTTTMVLEYARSWETDVPPAKRYTITFNVTQADNELSQSFKIVAGQTFDLIVETNPSAGYAWNMTQQPDAGVLKLVSSDVTGGGAVGAAQQQVWRFEGVAAGKTSFVLEYRGPGENAPVERKDTVNVTVAAAPTPAPTPPKTYTDPSAPITVERGEVFILQVKSSAGTGFQWRLAEEVNTSMLKFMGSATSAGQEIGGEILTEFTFEGLGPGQQVVKLGLYGPGGGQPSQVVEFNVTAK
jgi:predicted secreted protein